MGMTHDNRLQPKSNQGLCCSEECVLTTRPPISPKHWCWYSLHTGKCGYTFVLTVKCNILFSVACLSLQIQSFPSLKMSSSLPRFNCSHSNLSLLMWQSQTLVWPLLSKTHMGLFQNVLVHYITRWHTVSHWSSTK